MKSTKSKIIAFVSLAVPSSVLADVQNNVTLLQGGAPKSPDSLSAVACIAIKLFLDFIPFIVIIAAGAFIQGLIKYVGNGDNEEKRTEGRKMMIYGIVGFFFLVSIWEILRLFTMSFGIPLAIPQLNSSIKFNSTCQ